MGFDVYDPNVNHTEGLQDLWFWKMAVDMPEGLVSDDYILFLYASLEAEGKLFHFTC